MDDRLEVRYVVFKLNKLSLLHEKMLNDLLNADAPTVDCVVVEHDWPMYEKVVGLVLGESDD